MFYDLYLELCKQKKVAPTRAALDMGLSKSAPIKWRTTGATPQGETLNKIASYFGVSTDCLLGNEKKAPTPDGERAETTDDDFKAAFWGGEKDLSAKELDEMWEDVKEYARYKAEQRRKKKEE